MPLPPSTEISSPSAVLPLAKVRFPAPIVMRPAGPRPEGLAGPAGDGDARLIVDLDIADDLAAVGYRPDRGTLAGAVNCVAWRPLCRGAALPAPPLDRAAVGQASRSCPSWTFRRRRPHCRSRERLRPPPLIVPLLVKRRDRAGVGHTGAAGRAGKDAVCSAAAIAPLLVSVVIVPALDTPAPPAA